MNRFIAVKVGKGDAFYLENMEISFLVDGGASKTKLPALLSEANVANDIDIIVCTHSDEDHVNGLIGYFQSNKTCKEVWLPGSWMSRLDDMLNRPSDFIKELIENISDLDEDFLIYNGSTLEEIGDFISQNRIDLDITLGSGSKAHFPVLPYRNDNIESGFEILKGESRYDKAIKDENNDNKSSEEYSPNERKISFSQENFSRFVNELIKIPKNPFHQNTISHTTKLIDRNKIFNSAINAAEKILELATLAYKSGAKVRWFEYSNYRSGGGLKYLYPVNSIEIFQARKRLALEFLCLTKANIESLVFYAYNEDHSAGVLFCADSNFSFQQPLDFLSNCLNLIVTAPHHGAEANKSVYQKLAPYINSNTIFVRSDTRQSRKKSSPRPCLDYINLTYTKYCTVCLDQENKKDVILNYTQKGWCPDKTTKCICY